MAITTYTKSCAKHTPGIARVILFEADSTSIDTVTATADGLTVLTMAAAGDSVEVPVDRDGVTRMDEITQTKSGLTYVTQKLEMDISKASKDLQLLITTMIDTAVCGLGALVLDNNGVWWAMGLTQTAATTIQDGGYGMYVSSANFTSGKEVTEDGGDKYVITLEGVFPYPALPVKALSVVAVGTTALVSQPL
jgi:hypothetical protein